MTAHTLKSHLHVQSERDLQSNAVYARAALPVLVLGLQGLQPGWGSRLQQGSVPVVWLRPAELRSKGALCPRELSPRHPCVFHSFNRWLFNVFSILFH